MFLHQESEIFNMHISYKELIHVKHIKQRVLKYEKTVMKNGVIVTNNHVFVK